MQIWSLKLTQIYLHKIPPFEMLLFMAWKEQEVNCEDTYIQVAAMGET